MLILAHKLNKRYDAENLFWDRLGVAFLWTASLWLWSVIAAALGLGFGIMLVRIGLWNTGNGFLSGLKVLFAPLIAILLVWIGMLVYRVVTIVQRYRRAPEDMPDRSEQLMLSTCMDVVMTALPLVISACIAVAGAR